MFPDSTNDSCFVVRLMATGWSGRMVFEVFLQEIGITVNTSEAISHLNKILLFIILCANVCNRSFQDMNKNKLKQTEIYLFRS
jgi:hypothetical protein